MPSKPKGPQLWLEVPDHDAVVQRARNQLLEVGVERHRRDCLAVSPEAPLQGGIIGLQVAGGLGFSGGMRGKHNAVS